MDGDLIYLNGKPARWGDTGMDPDRLLGGDFVYQKIHTSGHRPLHAQAHTGLAAKSYDALYGGGHGLSAGTLSADIRSLLSDNRYPMGSNQVVLYLMPPSGHSGETVRILSCEKQLLYKGYTLWHTAMKAVVLKYECPFRQYKTAASLAAHNYSLAYAAMKNADISLTENHSGVITSAGEHPLFAVQGYNVFTTPSDDGATDSVERRLGIKAAELAGWNVSEIPVETALLQDYEEIFYITTQGIVSIGSYDGHLYPVSAVKAISSAMREIGDTGL